MTSIRKIDNITITFYVDPHHFYFKYDDDSRSDAKLNSINKNIEKYVGQHIEKRHSNPYSPEIGEIVLCHYISDCVSKWIRARVDTKLTYDKEKFVLWAVDYGFPLETESRWIRQLLSDNLKHVEKGLIFKGGLFEIVPSVVEWDFIQSTEESRKTKKWSAKAVECVEKYIQDAPSLTFKCRAYFEDHFFGSLIVQTNTGTKMVVEDLLKSLREGVDSINFLKEISLLEHLPYWQRQKQDAIYKVYENNSDLSTSKDTTMALWTGIDDLLNKTKIMSDLPKLQKIKDTKNADTDGELIKLSEQLETATELPPRIHHNTSSSHQASKPANLLPKRIDISDLIDEDGTVRVIPMNQRLAVAQQRIIEQGFIVDTKALAEKKKISSIDDSTKKKSNKPHYQSAKENEQCFSVHHKLRILVHGHELIPITPIESIYDAEFPQEVHTALKDLNINQVYRIQSIGWSHILRGSSMIFVNNPRTGKTWTYLPAIISLIIERIQDNRVAEGCGPLSVIACASAREVNEIAYYCTELLRYTDYGINCFKAYGFSDETNVVCQLLNGCEILVTTVPCLYRLMGKLSHVNFFNKERIITFVIDNIDLVYEQFGGKICEIHKSFRDATSDLQLIVTSRTWFKRLETFYTESDRVTLCIGSYIEAAVYGRTEMTIELLSQEHKVDKLITYVSVINYGVELSIVICNTCEDVEEIVKKLQATSIQTWNYHDKSDSCDIANFKKLINQCKSGDFRLLICTDEVLCDLDIRCAQHIVNFSLPSTWSMFAYRFSVLFDYHANLIDQKSEQRPATSVVFLDENNNGELPRLIDFMQMRGHSNIPEPVLKLAELKRRSRTNVYKLFCNDLLTIGVCHSRLTCNHRHNLNKFDRSRNEMPHSGYVKFEIIDIHSPVHFTVHLLEHRLPYEIKWTNLQCSDEILSFNMEMMKYFEDDENHVMHVPVVLGDLCAVCVQSDGGKHYERGRIIKIKEKKLQMVLTQYWVDILLIDSNKRMSCFSTELKLLPERFKCFPRQAIDVRIADLRPRDFDTEWDSQILAQVKQWLRNENHHYCQGLVKLSIMDTLWVDSVDVIEILQSINEEVKTVSVKMKLVARKFCVQDPKPLELIKGLAEKADLLRSSDSDVLLKDRSDDVKATQIVDRRTKKKELQVFHNSSSSSIDLDDSDIDRLNWTTSTDDDLEIPNLSLDQNLKNSSTSSEQDFLRLSKDKWAELRHNLLNKVALCNFYHPNRIYIRNHEYSPRLMELSKRINVFTSTPESLAQLSNVTLAENCLAKIGNIFSRAKIMKIFRDTDSTTAEVFFVDMGEFLILPVTELFEIPNSFITALPFQAIFCKIIGVRPSSPSAPEWCDNICDDIYDNLLVKQSHFYVRSMQLGSADKYAYGLRTRSYEVVLLDETGNVNINNWIVLNNYGEYDPDTKHFIDVVVGRNMLKVLDDGDSSDESDYIERKALPLVEDSRTDEEYGDFDVQFDDEDLKKFFQANQIPLTYDKSIMPLPEMKEAIPEIKESNEEETIIQSVDEQRAEKNTSSDEDFEVETKAELMSLNKYPNIKWHQTDTVIVLTIHAPDIEDYHLRITPRLVEIGFLNNHRKFAAVMNLFGCIDVQNTVHRIRGLNIVVRLVKTLNRLSWPRLVQSKERCHWLQYDFEAEREESKEFDSVETKSGTDVIQQDDMEYPSADSDDDDVCNMDN